MGRKNKVISEITKLCDLLKLQDVWRYQHPDQAQFTWRDKAFKVQCRLDYWLVYKQLSHIVIKSASTIGPGRGSTSYLTDFDETWPV